MNFLIDYIWKSAAVLAAAFGFAFALRRCSASLRYALWTCAIGAVLVLPAASWIVPRWNFQRDAAIARPQQAPVAIVVHAQRTAPDSSWPAKLPVILWMTGVVAMLARTAAGHWRARSLFGSAEVIGDPRWIALTREIAAQAGLKRRVILKRSSATDVPLSYGLLHPILLMPADAEHWTEERRRIVLCHEMVHARRLDSLWGLIAQCALAVNWFNPLAWLAVKRLKKEQERSCDDAVVLAGTERTSYAAHLVDLARAIAIPEPALGMAEAFDLEGRVEALLDSQRRRGTVSRKQGATMLLAALLLILPLAAVRAQSAGKASILGSVYDPSGAMVPNATISLQSTSGTDEEFAQADSNGAYRLPALRAGEYTLKVTAPGFKAYQRKVTLQDGAPARVDVRLAIGEVTETVEIRGARSQAAAAPAATPQRIRIGGMMQTIRLIAKVNPAYPEDARADGVEGTVVVKAVVSKEGNLLSVTPVSNGVDARLVSAAMAAIPLWHYEPAHLNGEPVEVVTTIAVTFRLN